MKWRENGLAADMTVAQAMNDPALRREIEALWEDEIIPVFAAIGKRDAAEQYLVALRERLLNPFLKHRLADIAQNHTQKKQRRFAPVISLAAQHGLSIAAVGTGAGMLRHGLSMTDPDPAQREAALDFILSMIDFGGALSAGARSARRHRQR